MKPEHVGTAAENNDGSRIQRRGHIAAESGSVFKESAVAGIVSYIEAAGISVILNEAVLAADALSAAADNYLAICRITSYTNLLVWSYVKR